MLQISRRAFVELVGRAYDAYPYEACGLLGGDPGRGRAGTFYPCRNTAESARVFQLDDRDYLAAERDADAKGEALLAIVHSHTHTEPYPSPTDLGVAEALGPWFRWVIVGLKREGPEVRSYRIEDGVVTEEPIAVV
jgi:proteasome lid subunit RPN8/RPN11